MSVCLGISSAPLRLMKFTQIYSNRGTGLCQNSGTPQTRPKPKEFNGMGVCLSERHVLIKRMPILLKHFEQHKLRIKFRSKPRLDFIILFSCLLSDPFSRLDTIRWPKSDQITFKQLAPEARHIQVTKGPDIMLKMINILYKARDLL